MADEYIKHSDALTVIERFNGYLDDDMQYRIKFMLNRDCPAADVVEVVRCKDCAFHYYAADRAGRCELGIGDALLDDDYCSRAQAALAKDTNVPDKEG